MLHIYLRLLGYALMLLASISSSVSMNFQKLAQHLVHFEDPRTCVRRREEPLKTPITCQPLFILAILLSIAASSIDFIVLSWLSPATVGVFGCLAIIINLTVSRIILYEYLNYKEWLAVAWVVLGCFIALATKTSGEMSELTPPEMMQRTLSLVYMVSVWIGVLLYFARLRFRARMYEERSGYPFIAGVIGSQIICMGKLLSYSLIESFHAQRMMVPLHEVLLVLILCVMAVILNVYWLNCALAKFDASYCIMVYQVTWFMWTVITGYVVFDDLQNQTIWELVLFMIGCSIALYGVWKLSVERNIIGPSSSGQERIP